MEKKVLLHIVEWLVALAALAYLVWRLATYDDYASLWAALQQMAWPQWTALVVCVLLMPVNMALEAWRWYSLMNEGINELKSERIKELKSEGINELTSERIKELKSERLTFREAQRQVYYSKLAGLITPWRLGEYPSRGLLMASEAEGVNGLTDEGVNDKALWARVLSMGAVGSATMTAAIVLAGVVALVFSPQVLAHLGNSYLYALAAVAVVLGGLMLLMPKALRKYAEVNRDLMLRSTMQSFVRLACWCVQLALVLYALGASQLSTLNPQLFPVYYLLVTITPNVPVVEVGVRGAWAIFVFGSVQAGLAGVLLWVINTLLPCAIWPFLQKSKRKFV